MTFFLGIAFLATHLAIVPAENDSVLSQMTRLIAGNGILYYWVQFFTMLILVLAANTGYQDFPRLSSFLANDGFLPRWLQNRGSRLFFSSGIVVPVSYTHLKKHRKPEPQHNLKVEPKRGVLCNDQIAHHNDRGQHSAHRHHKHCLLYTSRCV